MSEVYPTFLRFATQFLRLARIILVRLVADVGEDRLVGAVCLLLTPPRLLKQRCSLLVGPLRLPALAEGQDPPQGPQPGTEENRRVDHFSSFSCHSMMPKCSASLMVGVGWISNCPRQMALSPPSVEWQGIQPSVALISSTMDRTRPR